MPEYTWDMKGYASKYGFYTSENLSRREAERTLQLEPEPPKESDLTTISSRHNSRRIYVICPSFCITMKRCSMDEFIAFGAATATSDMIQSASLTKNDLCCGCD